MRVGNLSDRLTSFTNQGALVSRCPETSTLRKARTTESANIAEIMLPVESPVAGARLGGRWQLSHPKHRQDAAR
jgi:hypothetical protein